MTSFHIRLISDKKVVLVDASHHESEIFVPQMHQTGIVLWNIIRNRRPNPKLEFCDESTHGQDNGQVVQRPQMQARITTATAGLAPWAASIDGGAFRRVADEGVRCPQFSLKLISNGSVVLVECNVHESEIFLPQVCGQYITMKRITAHELVLPSKPKMPAIQPAKTDCLRVQATRFFSKTTNLDIQARKRRKRKSQEQTNHSGAGDQPKSKSLKR
ncbi:uncharacterized protein LOC6545362 [Drosophila erecta]|uniref:Uncharacterized protein n=1 Tax=Drosophila erecta TaxID=7220 RepID=B3NCW7_DROER|nr:uncharacterized protein LOC6545362 [Drosophila erecta]EDV51623.1 uncharacterized protein Dere_GG13796 [Drosophila erecta]